MKALDTNILVRFLVQDDKTQTQLVNDLLAHAENHKQPLYVSLLVVIELIWVLESIYQVSRNDLLASLEAFLSMPALRFEHSSMLKSFIDSASNNRFDLSDLLIGTAGLNAKCETTLTFDKKAAKSIFFDAL